jgi:hypothetical protein
LLYPICISLNDALNKVAERHVYAELGSWLLTTPVHAISTLSLR